MGINLLEDMKTLLRDDSLVISLAIVKGIHLAKDNSFLRCTVQLMPHGNEIISTYTFDSTGPNAGIYMFPVINDMVLVAFSENEDESYIIRRLNSKEDLIPTNAESGALTLRALTGKDSWLVSDSKILLARGETVPTENLVIGQVFKTVYTSHLDELINNLTKMIDLIEKLSTQRTTDSTHTHIGIFGVPVNVPIQTGSMIAEKALLDALKDQVETIKADVTTIKTDEVQSDNILSDFAFTEK